MASNNTNPAGGDRGARRVLANSQQLPSNCQNNAGQARFRGFRPHVAVTPERRWGQYFARITLREILAIERKYQRAERRSRSRGES